MITELALWQPTQLDTIPPPLNKANDHDGR